MPGPTCESKRPWGLTPEAARNLMVKGVIGLNKLPDVPPVWVRPTVVVEVEYRQRLEAGLRHAALKGIRPDKRPSLIRRSLLTERGPFSGFADQANAIASWS